MNNKISNRDFLSHLFRIIIPIIFLVISVIIFSFPCVKDGLQLLFVLPLFLGIYIFVFWNVITSILENICAVLLFSTIIIRYAISPLLMAISQSTIPGISSSPGSYFYAIVISVVELTVVMLGLHFFLYRKQKKVDIANIEVHSFGINSSLIGILAFGGLILLLLVRGNIVNVINHMSVLLHVVKNNDDLYTFDMNCMIAMKAIIFLVVANACYQKYRISMNKGWFFLACLAGVFNILFYDYSQRALLMELCLATVVILNLLFPEFKKAVRILFGLGIVIVLASLFIVNTLHFDNGLSVVLGNNSALASLSSIVEAYTNGISSMAYSIDSYSEAAAQVSILTFISEIIKNLGFLRFPVLRSIQAMVSSIPDTTSIWHSVLPYSYQAFIIPPITHANYYFTPYFGWIFDIFYFLGAIKLMSFFHEKFLKENDVIYKFIWTLYEILCSLCLCYNARILLHTFTYIPMYMLIICFFNKIGKKVRFTFRRNNK